MRAKKSTALCTDKEAGEEIAMNSNFIPICSILYGRWAVIAGGTYIILLFNIQGVKY